MKNRLLSTLLTITLMPLFGYGNTIQQTSNAQLLTHLKNIKIEALHTLDKELAKESTVLQEDKTQSLISKIVDEYTDHPSIKNYYDNISSDVLSALSYDKRPITEIIENLIYYTTERQDILLSIWEMHCADNDSEDWEMTIYSTSPLMFVINISETRRVISEITILLHKILDEIETRIKEVKLYQ